MKKLAILFLLSSLLIGQSVAGKDKKPKWNYFGSRVLIHSTINFHSWIEITGYDQSIRKMINPGGGFGIRLITSRNTELNIDYGWSQFWFRPNLSDITDDLGRSLKYELTRSDISPSVEQDLILSFRMYAFNNEINLSPFSHYFAPAPLGKYYKISFGIVRTQIAANDYEPYFQDQFEPFETFEPVDFFEVRSALLGLEVGREFPLSKKFLFSTAFSFNLVLPTEGPPVNNNYSWDIATALFDHNIWKVTYRLSFAL